MKQVINLKTQTEYNKLMKILEERGYKWYSGNKPTEFNYWSEWKEDFCVNFKENKIIMKCFIKYYQEEGHQIISLQEYLITTNTLEKHFDWANGVSGDSLTLDGINLTAETEFKVGDRVKMIGKSVPGYCSLSNSVVFQSSENGVGYITEIYGDSSGRDENNCLEVNKEKNANSGDFFAPKDLIKLTATGKQISQPAKIMNTLTNKLKRLLNKDLQTLYKAGYVDDCGDLTEEGREELELILRDENMEKLVTSADDKLKEEKENK